MKRDIEFFEKTIEPALGDPWDPPKDTVETIYKLVGVKEVASLAGWELSLADPESTGDAGTTGWILKREDVPSRIKYEDGYDGPQVGDTIALYTTNYSTVIGIAVNGEPYFLKSEREVTLEWLLYRAKHKREDHESLERNRDDYAERIATLPEEFRDRIQRFRNNNSEFDTQHLPYELMCCEDAVKIAAFIKRLLLDESDETGEVSDSIYNQAMTWGRENADDVGETPNGESDILFRWFSSLSFEEQKKHVDIDEGHSGNSFGMAMFLARAYVQSPRHVPMINGALSPLVGSKDYGDIDPTTGEVGGWPEKYDVEATA